MDPVILILVGLGINILCTVIFGIQILYTLRQRVIFIPKITGEIKNTGVYHSTFPQNTTIPPNPIPTKVERRKPIVIDDERAYHLERQERENRKIT